MIKIICENLGRKIKNEIKILSFGQSMRKIIMVKERVFFKTPILKCSKLQGSNVFSIKLNSFFSLK